MGVTLTQTRLSCLRQTAINRLAPEMALIGREFSSVDRRHCSQIESQLQRFAAKLCVQQISICAGYLHMEGVVWDTDKGSNYTLTNTGSSMSQSPAPFVTPRDHPLLTSSYPLQGGP